MTKTINVEENTYGKLLNIKNSIAQKNLASGNYKEINQSFDDIINLLIKEAER